MAEWATRDARDPVQEQSLINRQEARRLYVELIPLINTLADRLFESTEGEVLGIDPAAAFRQVHPLIVACADRLKALANLAPVANGFIEEITQAIAHAKEDPLWMASPPEVDPDGFLPPEEYVALMNFRGLADRLADIYGLTRSPDDYPFFTTPQQQLAVVCENIGRTVERLVRKAGWNAPTREDDIKQVLYASCLGAFPDVLPDGHIKFDRVLKGYKPDLGVPGLKTCVELKIARNMKGAAEILDQIIVDMSAYGSEDYTSFISVIYSDDEGVTTDLVRRHVKDKLALLGAEPRYTWTHIVARGPLAASTRTAKQK